MVYACDEARDDAGYPGPVQLSPIDLLRFKPLAHEPRDVFTIGRMSRPEPVKFHPGDPAFFIRLAADGCKVRVMGGECLLPKISPGSGVEIINGGSVPPQVFLNSLDCFFYRTDPDWFETFGRVVLEAMACGLPVVCEADAGYAPYIKSGENGFLFHTEAEAEAQIAALRADPELRARMGAAARRSVEAMYDGEYRRRLQEFYFGTANFSTDAATAG
jgi:glycosyltransferase involved in cell wall biosynthesis